jgi:Transposase DDE domain
LTLSHLQATQALASGIHAVPDASPPFNATIAACRFLNNPRVSLTALAQPLLDVGRAEAVRSCDRYVLVVHDWSQLMYPKHASKKDRISLSSRHEPEGYELATALLVSDRDGMPLAPGALSLRAADGVHCSRSAKVRPPQSPLDELDPTMTYLERQNFGRPLVHIIDAEADSVGHYRQWSSRPGRYYLVRADDRLVECAGQELRISALRQTLRRQGKLHYVRDIRYRGRKASQWIAEVAVRLTRPAQRNRPAAGDRRRIAGPPVDLRLVIAEVRDAQGKTLASWYLLSNVPGDVDSATIALWYYWRWSIETFFKLLKSAGLNVESWLQTTAGAIARRLMVACMACVTVWRLARSEAPQAEPAREMLVRLSGRQMKHGRKFTLPAMLAGMWTLLAMLEFLRDHTIEEAYQLAELCLPNYRAQAP